VRDAVVMNTRRIARLATILVAAGVLAACSSPGSAPSPSLQLRLVTSSTDGTCDAPALATDGPGTACSEDGTTTYQLGASLGTITPTSVTRPDVGDGQVLDLAFDQAGSAKLGEVTGKAIGKQLAILIEGRVLSAAQVADAITGGTVRMSFATSAEAARVAALLHATPSS
jgi:preprotein translocase subunit SecD